jgi:hypothetical protein
MRTKPALQALVAVLLALVVGACGGGGPAATGKSPTATQKPGNGTSVDCAKLTTAASQLVGIQLLAQLTTPETIESIKSFGNLDIDKLLAALAELHALDSVSTPLGDAKASIDFYQKAAKAAKTLLAMEPVTQAAIDAYNKDNVGTVGDFLGKQIAISGAMGEAGC